MLELSRNERTERFILLRAIPMTPASKIVIQSAAALSMVMVHLLIKRTSRLHSRRLDYI